MATTLWLDITLLGEHHIKHNLREGYEICHYFLGVNPVKGWVPVRPAQHYTMGGVRTNHTGEINTGKFLRDMGKRLEAWVHMKDRETDLSRLEERMEPELAEKIYELDRCIECGCCIAAAVL